MRFPWRRKRINVDPHAIEDLREAIGGYALKRKRLKVAVILLVVVTLLVGVVLFQNERLQQQLDAPEHVIKSHEAGERIIYGPHYDALKSRHPDQPAIPPMDQWGQPDRRKR